MIAQTWPERAPFVLMCWCALTFGRQYDAAVDMWTPFTAAGNTIGDLAAHPFDNDNADQDFRFNNAVKYVSPVFHGFRAEGVYGFSNSTHFAANRAYSAALSYGAGGSRPRSPTGANPTAV